MGVRLTRKGEGIIEFQADNINMEFLETADFAKQAAALEDPS